MENKIFVIWLACMVLVSGCLTETAKTNETQTGKEYPLTITDDLGRNVTIRAEPERIISTAPSNTEILFALGLGDRIVGVTEYCNWPPEALEKEKIGGFSTVSVEKTVALNPDVVFASDKTGADNIEKLENFGIPVVVLRPKVLEDVLENIELAGKITGTKDKAKGITDSMQNRIDAVKAGAEKSKNKPRVFFAVSGEPLMAAGPETLINNLIEASGGANVFADAQTRYPVISLESVLDRDPEIIITNTRDKHTAIDFDEVAGKGEWQGINAVKNSRMYVIDADIVSRPGPRIVDALEQFAQWIREYGTEDAQK
ncbi:MAG: hypothetical protein MSIBF_00215 [Candidatus Altiarchaeales archaeon IMC4]|nr:MAG: hypothetical protein MSIBF_00215 [Candidatus Altiarchaeales archaeon IMC4]